MTNELANYEIELAPIQIRQRGALMAYVEQMIPVAVKMEKRTECKDEGDLGVVVAEGTAINKTAAVIEKIRTAAKAPWVAGGRMVDEAVKPIAMRFDQAAKKGKDLVRAYHAKIAEQEAEAERKRLVEEERRRKIQAAHEAAGHNVKEDITPVAPIAKLIDRTPAKTYKRWVANVIDKTQIPHEFLLVDQVAINNRMRAWRSVVEEAVKNGTPTPADLVIPGVQFEEIEDVRY
jgi:hypothetical protein